MKTSDWIRTAVTVLTFIVGIAGVAVAMGSRISVCEARLDSQELAITARLDRIERQIDDIWKYHFQGGKK